MSRPAPEDSPLADALAAQGALVARLQAAVAEATDLGSLRFQRLAQTMAAAQKSLAEIRRQHEDATASHQETTAGARQFIASTKVIAVIEGLLAVRQSGVLTPTQADAVYQALVGAGLLEHSGYTARTALAAYHQAMAGQRDLDAEALHALEDGNESWIDYATESRQFSGLTERPEDSPAPVLTPGLTLVS